MSVDVLWAALLSHQRPLRALYQRCAPAGIVEELKRLSQRLRGTKRCPGVRKIRPGTAIVRGVRPRCASGGISGWSGGAAKECPTNGERCGAGGAVGPVRVPKKG